MADRELRTGYIIGRPNREMGMFYWVKKARPDDTRFDYMVRMAIPFVGEDILLQSVD